MDRQAHDYAAAAAMAYAQQQQQAAKLQQQQQFGLHPQHQQFPQQVHGPPFLPPHPSLQQFPYHHHLQQQQQQQQQQQLHPHPHHHHHVLHLQQQQQPPPNFSPHVPPHLVPSPFHSPFDSAPPPAAPPSDPELQKRIDKLVEYAAKNGPEFEAMIREKQQDNPAYSFLFGGEGHSYYRYKLWVSTVPSNTPFNPSFPSSSMPMMRPPHNSMINPSLNTPLNVQAAAAAGPSASMMGAPQLQQPPFPPFYDQQQQHLQPLMGQGRPDYEAPKSFKGLSGPLPSDVAAELGNVLNNLTGTKESIKSAKIWFMHRCPFAPALAEALKDRMLALDDSDRQLHIIYLANDILFDSLQRRKDPRELDNEAFAFRPVLGSMLARIYYNPHNREANQSRLQQILQFWASKEVYDPDTIYGLEGEMIGGPPASSFSGPPKELSASSAYPTGLSQSLHQWQPDQQRSSVPGSLDQELPDKQVSPVSGMTQSLFASPANQQFLSNSVPAGLHQPITGTPFMGSVPIPGGVQPGNQLPTSHILPTSSSSIGEKLPPYPLFPPGLIPGMVRKMQIGSGVPYSPMSPLDIPTVIPPSTISPSDVLERVSKFFKEIGEVNPSEGPMKSSNSNDEDDEEYEREPPVRKGGACIPPPLNLQVDPETGTYADGSVERKPGSSGSGRLGLGATANPNEVSQYDDVYTSYRKQRSTSYHTSMSARAAAR